RRRFRREAEAIARLEHPNIVKIYEVGEAEGRPFLSLEYVDGGSLAQQLTGTPLPPRQAARLIALLSQAIETAHQQGFVHRDLKPANILLSTSRSKSPARAGTAPAGSVDSCHAWLNCIPKITDFGLAKELDNGAAQTRSGTIMGTPCYMAPEQTTAHGASIRPATDVYALGAILYELLTGRPPFQGQTPLDTLNQVQADDPVPPRRLQSKLAVDLETICLKCLQKDPNHRYGRAALLADDLNRFLAGCPVAARPIPVWERLAKYARRKPALVALLMVSAAAFLLSIIGVVWHTIRLQQALNTADELRVTAQSERDRALAQERLVREYGGRADVQLTHALLKNADVRQAVELLGKYRPEAGQDDIREFTWHYLWRLCQGDQRTLTGHTKDVYFVTFSPDGKLLATAGEDG